MKNIPKAILNEYKTASLTNEEIIVKNFFNFSIREMANIGHNKLTQLYDIIKTLDQNYRIYFGFVERPLDGKEKSLRDVIFDHQNMMDNEVVNYINEVYNKSVKRKLTMDEIRTHEHKIPISKEEQEYNLYCNLLDI